MNKKDFISVSEAAKIWRVSERMVTNYLLDGRVPGAVKTGKDWKIPANALKPTRANGKKETLLDVLRREDASSIYGGIYHRVQIELTYNSNHIEGSKLTHDQTRYIFETNTIIPDGKFKGVKVDDIVETANHFRCIDYIIENANRKISENMIKELHKILKNGTSDSRADWFMVGDYKKMPNEVGLKVTTSPEDVPKEMKKLLSWYEEIETPTLKDLLEFHYRFETIHPFQDGNGRIGRLIMFKECLRLNIVPFIIDEDLKAFYYRGLTEWRNQKGYLTDTCLTAQDEFKKSLDYFGIQYTDQTNSSTTFTTNADVNPSNLTELTLTAAWEEEEPEKLIIYQAADYGGYETVSWSRRYAGCSPEYYPTVTTSGIIGMNRPSSCPGCGGSLYTSDTYDLSKYSSIEIGYYKPSTGNTNCNPYSLCFYVFNASNSSRVKTLIYLNNYDSAEKTYTTLDISDVTGSYSLEVSSLGTEDVIYYIRLVE